MRNLIRVFVLMIALVGGSAYAADCNNINTSGLSDAAAQAVRLACQAALAEQAKRAESGIPIGETLSDPNQLSQWGVVAQEWAKALGIAANELGIAVDNFLDTDAGKLTAAVIIWQVAGERIIDTMIGVPLLIATIWIGLRIARRWRFKSIEYGAPRWFGLRRGVAKITYDDGEGATILSAITYIVTILLSWIIIANVVL